MKNVILFIVLTLISINIVVAEDYPAGEPFTLYHIDRCEGPVYVKMTSTEGVKKNDYQIEKCIQKSLILWECECSNSFDVKILTDKSLVKTYDVLIQYFLDYDNIPKTINGTPSIAYITQQGKIRAYSMLNINIAPVKRINLPFELDIDAKNAMVVGVIVFVGILLFVFIKFKDNIFGGNDENNDILNYKIENEEDIQSILDSIK